MVKRAQGPSNPLGTGVCLPCRATKEPQLVALALPHQLAAAVPATRGIELAEKGDALAGAVPPVIPRA
ncbi:MAG TPA: hypothetical protein VL356_09505 [Acidocella sp.]|jgi:hypothetical protein|nr:hypothetical protein [Acidocella sp.]